MTEITEKTLIEMGYKPGKWFARALESANANQLTGRTGPQGQWIMLEPPT